MSTSERAAERRRERKRLPRAGSGNCAKCDVWRRSLHNDHIVPIFKGGADDITNVQKLCANCHEDKTREDLTGWPLSGEARRKQAAAQRGKPISDHRRAAITATNRIVCTTPEFREKMRWVALNRPPQNLPKLVCDECGMTTKPGPMRTHQNASGHLGFHPEGALF